MPTVMIINKEKKGATLRLHLTISSKDTCLVANSEPFKVDNCASVTFRVINKEKRDVGVFHNISIAFRKEDVVTDIPYTMIITCKMLNYSEQWICPENWRLWLDLGDLKASLINDNYLSAAEVCITAYRDIIKPLDHLKGHVKFYEDTEFTDFRLSAKDGTVAVHKSYLAAHSDVFKKMLTSDWQGNDEGVIELKGVTLKTLQQLKEYLYLGTLPDDDLCPLLLLASHYCIEDMKAACITRLALRASPEEVHAFMEFACDFKIPELCMAITYLTPEYVIHRSYATKKEEAAIEKVLEE